MYLAKVLAHPSFGTLGHATITLASLFMAKVSARRCFVIISSSSTGSTGTEEKSSTGNAKFSDVFRFVKVFPDLLNSQNGATGAGPVPKTAFTPAIIQFPSPEMRVELSKVPLASKKRFFAKVLRLSVKS